MDVNQINNIQVDAQAIYDDEQSLKVRFTCEDGAGIDMGVRVDLRFVSVQDAVAAVASTFLFDLIQDRIDEDEAYSDILVTRRITDNEISFCVLTSDGQEFSLPTSERFRP